MRPEVLEPLMRPEPEVLEPDIPEVLEPLVLPEVVLWSSPTLTEALRGAAATWLE